MKMFFVLLGYNFACIIIIGIISGLLIAAIPSAVFTPHKISTYHDFKFEDCGRFYDKYFKISVWKDKLPQFSEIVHKGFSKGSLKGIDKAYLGRFYLETIRAEFCHRVLILCAPVFYVLNKSSNVGIVFTILYIIGNIPFIMIQRYNRPRIKKIMTSKAYKNKFVD
ncbi:MAG: glycosyl-4,4'-diaponeurosporenoate acyltransferase [Clostridia bacterium]|nr:glycosyl-4,4'-diaponeurosporenoate acyltransferase [Clostridia bacterium]